MNKCVCFYLYIIVVSSSRFVCCFEPISMCAGALAFGAAGYTVSQTYCRFYECCDERNIPGNTDELYNVLKKNLYGQHIVIQHVVPALAAHFSPQSKSRKPLVISFHGTPGTGKNFVADQIANALYKKGVQSKYVHKYLGRSDFPHSGKIALYMQRINQEVRASIKDCPRSMFIFDEVDKMPSGIFDTLRSLVDYNSFADGSDNSKSIFIFLTNTAGVNISNHLGKLMKAGTLREETRLSDFEELLRRAAYNLEGGLQKTSLIESHVIDHYVPFLPLEKSHVVQCLIAEFNRWDKHPNREVINDIIASTITYDAQHDMYSISGCKTIEKQVAMAVHFN